MEDMIPLHGLRGVCAIAIMLGHQSDFFLQPAVPQKEVLIGWEYLQAVALFFLLSGIPMARLYSSTNKVATWQGAREFWRKRVARLAPMYYGTLILNAATFLWICRKVDVGEFVASFVFSSLFLESLFVGKNTVALALWQVSVFVIGYLLFPFVSTRIRGWSACKLLCVMGILWIWSAALWGLCFLAYDNQADSLQEDAFTMVFYTQLMWHEHCITRLPQMIAGMLLGELVEQMRHQSSSFSPKLWSRLADMLSLVLLLTAILSPIIQWYYGSIFRFLFSFSLEALLLPLHSLWLASIVLAHPDGSSRCWTRRFLSLKPLQKLGDISLVLYCIHLGLMFLYMSAYAYFTTGDWHLLSGFGLDDISNGTALRLPYWHAPIQWAMVLVLSYYAALHFEAPLRKYLSRSPPQLPTGRADETTALLENAQSSGVA